MPLTLPPFPSSLTLSGISLFMPHSLLSVEALPLFVFSVHTGLLRCRCSERSQLTPSEVLQRDRQRKSKEEQQKARQGDKKSARDKE